MESNNIEFIKIIYEYNCKFKIEASDEKSFILYTLENKDSIEEYFGYNNNIFEVIRSEENKFIITKALSKKNDDEKKKIDNINTKYSKKEYFVYKVYKVYKGLKYNNYYLSKKIINIESKSDGFFINPKIEIKEDLSVQNKIAYLYNQNELVGIVNDYRNITLLESIKKNRDIVFLNSNTIEIYTYREVSYFKEEKEDDEKFNIYLEENINSKDVALVELGCKVQKDRLWLFLIDDADSDAIENSVILILPNNTYCKCIIRKNSLIIKKVFKSKYMRGEAFVYIIDNKDINFTKDIKFAQENDKFNTYIARRSINNDFLKMINKYKTIENEVLEQNRKGIQNLIYSNLELKENGRFFIKAESVPNLEKWYGKEGSNICYIKNRRYYDIGILKEVDENSIVIEFKDDRIRSSIPRKKGELSISFYGDQVIQQRREKAILLIENNLAAISDLALMLTGDYIFNNIPYKFIFPKSQYENLNKNQVESIEGALNTPDLFLIQGPPGTGKTSVIRKIVSEIVKKGKEPLITSYQNLAVDNVLDGFIQENVIPYRYGTYENPVMSKICMDIVNDIEENLKYNVSSPIEEKLENDKKYIKKMIRKINNTDDILNDLNDICEWMEGDRGKAFALEQLVGHKNSYLAELQAADQSIDFSVDDLKNMFPLSFDYDLEIMESFKDIQKYISDANQSLKSQTLENVRKIIEKLSDLDTFIELDDSKYQNIKISIFNELKLVKVSKNESDEKIDCFKYKEEITAILDNLHDKIDKNVEDEQYKKVKQFYTKIKNTPILLEDVLKKYSDIKGTTCQKTASKGFIDSTKGMNYEYVIVDEASRANPLDLLIPLVKGSKIILVGDHKQLPHMIDNEVDRKLREEDNDEQELINKYIKESLFGRLFKEFPNDRKIMLDIQYRMTRQIGDLVSELFYGGKLKTGTDIVNDFEFYNGNSLIYIDINGTEIKTKSSSYINKAECEEIVESLYRFDESLNSNDKNEKASVGIISFYKSQVNLLNEEIVKTRFKNLDIQIGTVDSFQGLEKDVIFLSTVRTNGIGFIANPNRLNVALSRAKKLIVLFGKISNLKGNCLMNKIIEKFKDGGTE